MFCACTVGTDDTQECQEYNGTMVNGYQRRNVILGRILLPRRILHALRGNPSHCQIDRGVVQILLRRSQSAIIQAEKVRLLPS